MKTRILDLLNHGRINKRQGRSHKIPLRQNARRQRRSSRHGSLQFAALEPRQLLAATEIAFWEFSDPSGVNFQNSSIIGSQAADVEWRFGRTEIQTNEGNLTIPDNGSNQFYTDLRQRSNTSNLNPLDLTGETQLRLEVNYDSWDITNADNGTVHRFDLKRQDGTVHALIRLNKTAIGSEILLMFNDKYETVPVTMTSGEVGVTLDLDLTANTADYRAGPSSGTIVPTNGSVAYTNETLNFGIANTFLGDTSSSDSIVIDSMGLSAIPPVTRSIQSGDWTSTSSWDNGLPDGTTRAIVSQGTTITLDGLAHVAESLVVHGVLDVAENGTNRSLTSNWIHVNSGGVFQVGTAANRFDNGEFTVTLTGTNVHADHIIETATGTISVADNDGFLMSAMNGQLQFFGEAETTFTKLAATAGAGVNTIVVENVIERNFDGTTSVASDGSIDWQAGDEIVIASSTRDYSEEDVRTIVSVNDTGTQSILTLNSVLDNRHYGEVETYDNGIRTWDLDLRAEVALLSRSITIQGTQDTDGAFGDRANYGSAVGQNLGIGGHTMIMNGSGLVTVDGVRFDQMGQTGQLGRYPIHWHLAGDRTGDMLRNSSVTNSNNRGATVHGTHGLLLEGNVFHDIHGHGFFMEDGVETENQYLNNIAFGIHRVGGDNTALSDPFIVDTHDVVFQDSSKEVSSAAFWITNPDNTWIGNISAGSEGTGFWFVLPASPIGVSANDPIYAGVDPSRTDLKSFLHNSSHTSELGLVIDRGADVEIEIGDPIFQGNGQLAGRYYPPTPLHIEHFTAYKQGGAAIYTNVEDGYTFDEFMYADNFISSFQLRTKTNSNTLYVGNSRGNANLTEETRGHALYNGLAILKDSHFAGFNDSNTYFFAAESAPKRQHYQLEGVTFENDGTANQIRLDNPYANTLNNRQLHVAGIDVDGSFTGHVGGGPGSTVVPNHPFYQDGNDFAPAGWDLLISDNYYATVELTAVQGLSGEIVQTTITNPAGASVTMNAGQNLMLAGIKLGWGDYTVEFPQGLGAFADEGFDFAFQMYEGDQFVAADNKANVFKFVGIGSELAPRSTPNFDNLADLRSATETAYHVDTSGDLWMKVFYDIGIDFFVDVVLLPTMSLEVDPATVSENAGSATGTLTRPADTTGVFTATLVSSDITEATVPSSVTIPAGQDSVDFTIDVIDDAISDGTQQVLIAASATGFVGAEAKLQVLDDDDVMLQDFYVSTTGSDDNLGTLSQPLATINRGMELVQPGYTVYVRGGTYREVIQSFRSGTVSEPITVSNYNNEGVYISASDVVDGIWTETSSGSGIYSTSVSNSLPTNFWTSSSPSTNGTEVHEIAGNFVASVVNESNFHSANVKSSQSSNEWDFFIQPVSLQVRGISIESTGSTAIPLSSSSTRFSLFSDSSTGWSANDSVNVQFYGDGRLQLFLNKDTTQSWGANVGSVTDASISGFDLTLQPGASDNIDYTLTAFPSGQTVADGLWSMAKSDWSDGGDGSQSFLQLFAQESVSTSIDVTQQFEVRVDSVQVGVSGTTVLNDEFDDGDLETANFFSGRDTSITSGYDQVFVNGEMQNEARDSNKTSLDLLDANAVSFTMDDNYTLAGSAFGGKPDDFYAGARFLGRVGQGWSWQTAVVTSSSGNTLQLDPATASTWWWPNFQDNSSDTGIGYVYGKLDFLDTDREWHLDQNASGDDLLYLRVDGSADPNNQLVEKKSRNWTVNINGHDNVVVKGFNLRGGAVQLNGSNIIFEDNDARYLSHYQTFTRGFSSNGGNASGSGVLVNGANNIVRRNSIYDTAGSGVVAGGSNHLITRNTIYNTDYSGTYATGLALDGTGHTATFNTIHDSGRDILRPTGSGLTVMYNDLSNAGRLALDVGIIYTFGVDGLDANGDKSRIAYNWVHGNGNEADRLSKGIYLDNFTRNYILDHNFIFDIGANMTSQSGIKLNSPLDNVEVYNNTLVGAPTYNITTFTPFPESNPNSSYWNSSTHRLDYVGQNNLIIPNGSDPDSYFEDFAGEDFRPLAGTAAVDPATTTGLIEWTTTDGTTNVPSGFLLYMREQNQLFGYREVTGQGVAIAGITDNFFGTTPDSGAYESGAPLWRPGVDGFETTVATVVAKGVAYGNATASYGAAAIDPTKQPLLPGQTATFANYTSHSRGLNRVVIEVSDLPTSTLTTDDFEFRVGNTDSPSNWQLLDAASTIPLPSISVSAPIAGVSSILLTWPDNAIVNNWLQVNLRSTDATGLANTDTFYFGNAIGETGNDPANTRVNLVDVGQTRANQTGFTPASIENVYDFNRDGRVNLIDVGIARANQTGFTSLRLFNAPTAGSFSSNRNSESGNVLLPPSMGISTIESRNGLLSKKTFDSLRRHQLVMIPSKNTQNAFNEAFHPKQNIGFDSIFEFTDADDAKSLSEFLSDLPGDIAMKN